MHTNQLDSSEFYLNQCNNLIEENNMPANSTDGKLVPNYYRALCRIKQNRFKDAADLLITEISRLGNLRQDLINEYSLLVEVYLKLGDVKNATETFALYSTLQEQLKADERNNSKMSFETELKIASAEGMIKDLKTEKNVASITRNYLTGISLLLLVLVLIVFNRFRIKKRANIALEEKNRIISIEKANVEKEKVRAENALTDLKLAQKQLVKSEKMAAFGLLASRVSHEILNPLNFVNNFSELAQETVTDVINSESPEDKKENADILISNLQKINEHGKRATVIVKQLQEHISKGKAQEFFETEQ